jgi:hypothetical protein
MRDELSDGFDHLWQAAVYAAEGIGARVGPKWDSAKEHLPPRVGRMRDVAAQGMDSTLAAFSPLMEAARAGAVNATRKAQKAARRAERKAERKKESAMARRRTTVLVGLLTAGTAAGAAGAIMLRRRNRNRWQEYEAPGLTAEPTVDQTIGDQTTGQPANVFAEQATQAGGKAATRTGEAIEPGTSRTDPFAEKAHTISKNNRN